MMPTATEANSGRANNAIWTPDMRRAVDAIATLFSAAYMLARSRALSSPSPTIRALARSDGADSEAALLQRENDILRRRMSVIQPSKRPLCAPEDRFAILQLMRLRNWTIQKAAERFVLHPNTIRDWKKRFQAEGDAGPFFGGAPFNRIADGLRWVVHEIRALCPRKEFGTRAIAMAILREGVRISRSSVQRILREEKPADADAGAQGTPAVSPALDGPEDAVEPHNILWPGKVNRTWHLDLATIEFLWMRLYVAAVVDGFSRKLLALRVYADAPNTRQMIALFRQAVAESGGPRFIVTDHGSQFGKTFTAAVEKTRVGEKTTVHVRGRVHDPKFNGKAERFVKTFRIWQRLTLFAWNTEWIQRHLDTYRDWYNTERPMWILDGRTPDEMWRGDEPPAAKATPIRQADPVKPTISVTRHHFGGDRNLPRIEIRLERSA